MSFLDVCNTTCPYCGVGCGVEVRESSEGFVVAGDKAHPANHGKLCVKGTALADTIAVGERVRTPIIRGRAATWEAASEHIAGAIERTVRDHGPQAVAFYLSGQLLTEDYYVANKLMKGFIGSSNVDTNSRLCMSSAVAGYKRSFGADFVPCQYSDLDDCDLLLLIGSNAAWTHPVLYQRIVAAKKANPRKHVVLIDPRRTATADLADQHLALRPGSDGFLFGGLLCYLSQRGHLNHGWLTKHAAGLEDSVTAVADLSLEVVSRETGISVDELQSFFDSFAQTERVVSFYSQGINQSATGTDKVNAIINCHLATGRIGLRGAGPFSITGQPNAMGGREVGGLANQLAAHMDFDAESIDRVSRFWGAPNIARNPGLKAVDMFDAVHRGEIRFLWVMATNPAVSLPNSERVRETLAQCETLVVSECVPETDTAKYASVLLPAAGWGEKDGTVTNSERVISRQRSFLRPEGEALPDWRIVAKVAEKLGYGSAFAYATPAEVFAEHAALSAFENEGTRAFDIGGLASLSGPAYDALSPVRWPCPAGVSVERSVPGYHPDKKVHLIPVTPVSLVNSIQRSTARWPLNLNTGRLRDQWHTMTRTGLAPRLARHSRFFSVAVNRGTADRFGLVEGGLARVENGHGTVHAIVAIDNGLADDALFLPIHWSDVFASDSRVSALIPPLTDPVSGQPQSKFAKVAATPLAVKNWALLVSHDELSQTPVAAYASRARVTAGDLWLLADADIARLEAALEEAVGGEMLATSSVTPLVQKRAWFAGDKLQAAVFVHEKLEQLPAPARLESLLDRSSPQRRWDVLSAGDERAGRQICSCHEIDEPAIVAAIGKGAVTIEALGELLKCGTGCGSCQPELQILLNAHTEQGDDGGYSAVG